MTRAQRQAVVDRVQSFRREFARVNEASVILCEWFVDGWDSKRSFSLKKMSECGSVGCLGGYCYVSKSYGTWSKSSSGRRYKGAFGDRLYKFFGVNREDFTDLFAGRRDSDVAQKAEALARIDSVLEHHNAKLARI